MKKIKTMVAIVFCALALTGCMDKKGNDVTDITDTDNHEKDTDTENKMDTIEEKARNDINNKEDITKEKIQEAVTYIDEHINDPFKDETTTEKLAYYGAYLKYIGQENNIDSHEFAILGSNVHTYIKNIYNKKQTEMDDISTNLKTDIQNSLDTIHNQIDKFTNEFYDTIHKTTYDNTIKE